MVYTKVKKCSVGDRKLSNMRSNLFTLLTCNLSLQRRNIQGIKVYNFLLVLQYPFDTEKIYRDYPLLYYNTGGYIAYPPIVY